MVAPVNKYMLMFKQVWIQSVQRLTFLLSQEIKIQPKTEQKQVTLFDFELEDNGNSYSKSSKLSQGISSLLTLNPAGFRQYLKK